MTQDKYEHALAVANEIMRGAAPNQADAEPIAELVLELNKTLNSTREAFKLLADITQNFLLDKKLEPHYWLGNLIQLGKAQTFYLTPQEQNSLRSTAEIAELNKKIASLTNDLHEANSDAEIWQDRAAINGKRGFELQDRAEQAESFGEAMREALKQIIKRCDMELEPAAIRQPTDSLYFGGVLEVLKSYAEQGLKPKMPSVIQVFSRVPGYPVGTPLTEVVVKNRKLTYTEMLNADLVIQDGQVIKNLAGPVTEQA
ncbi:MAG: hypothetical protein ACREGB_00060 [Candidatus Saccharimonadales bacterium]